ncbi:MAG: hypothetical protein ACR2JF_18155 [Iamia sp.]
MTNVSRRAVTGAVGAVVVVILALVLLGGGAGDDAPPLSTPPSSASSAPSVPGSAAAPPVASVDGTLERAGDDLAAQVTITNGGTSTLWVPVGRGPTAPPGLVPAAVGGGVVDLGWLVSPVPEEVDGVAPTLVFRPVAPGAAVELSATDAPPPPEALVDTSGEQVTDVSVYRLCVDAFADAALAQADRTPVEGGDGDIVFEVGLIDGESSRTCGPTVPA